MRRPFLLAVGIVAAIPFGSPARAASSASVSLGYERIVVPVGSGFEVVVLCNASAVSPDQLEVALATVVSCSVNGNSANRATPGRESYVTVNTIAVAPYTVCISGEAAFTQPLAQEFSIPSSGPSCTTWPL